MPLLQQWVRQRPWLAAGLAVSATGLAGLSGGALAAAGALGLAVGGIAGSRPVDDATHPLRRRILTTLENHPGLCYRELQQSLGAANGTLRHHLDVLQGASRLTVMHVNGRTCYFAGPPESVELLQGRVGMSRAAERLPIGLSLTHEGACSPTRGSRECTTPAPGPAPLGSGWIGTSATHKRRLATHTPPLRWK